MKSIGFIVCSSSIWLTLRAVDRQLNGNSRRLTNDGDEALRAQFAEIIDDGLNISDLNVLEVMLEHDVPFDLTPYFKKDAMIRGRIKCAPPNEASSFLCIQKTEMTNIFLPVHGYFGVLFMNGRIVAAGDTLFAVFPFKFQNHLNPKGAAQKIQGLIKGELVRMELNHWSAIDGFAEEENVRADAPSFGLLVKRAVQTPIMHLAAMVITFEAYKGPSPLYIAYTLCFCGFIAVLYVFHVLLRKVYV